MKILTNFYSFLVLPINVVDTEKGKILWLIKLRWLFLVVQFFLVVPFLMGTFEFFKDLYFYIGLCALLSVFNVIVTALAKSPKKFYSENLTLFCLSIDLIWFSILFWLLVQVGQFHAENIYFIHAVLGAILLTGRKSLFFYLLIASCLFIIQMYQYNYFPQNQFLFNQFILFSVWRITSSVSKYVFSQREQLSQMKIHAEKMDRLRAVGALTAGFSHEFASPLNTIKLRLNRISRRVHDDVDVIAALEAVDNCEKVIKQINSSQVDKRDLVFQSINIEKVINETLESWKHDHPEARVVIKNMVKIPYTIKIPLINLSQGLLNILDNAYESDSQNDIIIEVEMVEGRLIISITDSGEGFSKDVLERFGEPFVTTKKEGTGLGLYSFHLFAQSIGGSVSIENLNPRGALVKFTTPVSVG